MISPARRLLLAEACPASQRKQLIWEQRQELLEALAGYLKWNETPSQTDISWRRL